MRSGENSPMVIKQLKMRFKKVITPPPPSPSFERRGITFLPDLLIFDSHS